MTRMNEFLRQFAMGTLVMIGICSFRVVLASDPGQEGGGGDTQEIRVNVIRTDILNWIKQGGSKGLDFQSILTQAEYDERMIEVLEPKQVVIGFVDKDSDTDEELQVSVEGVPKTCRGFRSKKDQKLKLICNIERFKNTEASDQYRLIHHEYAGLARVEKNDGASSDYFLSTQLTDFLVAKTELKLAILRPVAKFSTCGLEGSISQRIKDCEAFHERNFDLVTRLPNGDQFWMDRQSKRFWTGKTYKTRIVARAIKTCKDLKNVIPEINWSLPKIRDLKKVTQHGGTFYLENFDIKGSYWSREKNNSFSNYGYRLYSPDLDYVSVLTGKNHTSMSDEEYDQNSFARFHYKCVGKK